MSQCRNSIQRLGARKGPRDGSARGNVKPDPPPATENSLFSIFDEVGPRGSSHRLSLESVRHILKETVRDASFIDRQNLQTTLGRVDLSSGELTRTFNSLAKIGRNLREVAPGLFLKEPKDTREAKQIVVARFALARYLASLAEEGGTGVGVLGMLNLVKALLAGNQVEDPLMGKVGDPPLLDALLPQWRKIGDPEWKPLLGRHRGNWMEKVILTVPEYISRQLLMIFLLQGWPIAEFETDGTEARHKFTAAFQLTYELACHRKIAKTSLYSPLRRACAWSKTDPAKQEMDLQLEMDIARIRDAKRHPNHLL